MNLYLRLLKVLLSLPFLRRRGLFDASHLRFRVWPTDCDINLHMNNGRYLTFMDLGRVHMLAQIGLLGTVVRRGWRPVLTAAEVSFIRALGPLQAFTLTTRLLTWDDKYFYLEQRFERGDTLCAIAMLKGLFLARTERVPPVDALGMLGVEMVAPEMPPVIQRWNDLIALKKQYSDNS